MPPKSRINMGNTNTFSTVDSLQEAIINSGNDHSVGFVPTMGALHRGHMSLVERAALENDVVVVSIFVNPTQFNNSSDLEKYPRDLERDLRLLEECKKDVIVFAPDVKQIYPQDYSKVKVDLDGMDRVMEGKFRPGHFDGVVEVVSRLFDIVKPTRAYFGLKDFQQLAIIKKMVKELGLSVEIVPCEIIRSDKGLAESSRNERLSSEQKNDALVIYRSLLKAKEIFGKQSTADINREIARIFSESPLELEYFELVDPTTLKDVSDNSDIAQACVAAYCGDVRLIDNMQLKKHVN